jgi:predicted DNA-binding protein
VKDLPIVVRVDMGDLDGEKENLANFLRSQFGLNSSIIREGLELKMEDVSTYALARDVNKFVYRKNLNSTHWVNVKNNVVIINRFKHKKEAKKNKHPTTPSTIKHGW